MRLVVLGAVAQHGQAHGYAVLRELAAWRVETWTRLKPGSIYHALRQLTREGKLRGLGTEPGSGGPARTRYELTSDGQAELHTRLGAALASFDVEELGVGVAFMHLLPRERVLELLRDQHQRARATCEHLAKLGPHFPDRAQPPHTPDLLELWSGGVGAVADFTAGLVQRLESGDYEYH